ncbi:IPTL-CTERM sorting domain-containing protein [Ottowia sp. GY511]|nr:IPTL-CTERM sorting domain-containing protein [Ottowia sp. GY511]
MPSTPHPAHFTPRWLLRLAWCLWAMALLFAGAAHAQAGLWTASGDLATARTRHTATLLPNGKVLVAGGANASGDLVQAELYDPATGTWAPAAGMLAARSQHTATLLPNGKVLMAGGFGAGTHAELYDPDADTWTATGSLTQVRVAHTATLLANGSVLVAGGISSASSSAEIYNPATGTWTATGSLGQGRFFHAATLLPGGKVLVAGGTPNGDLGLISAELYDPVNGTWATTGALATGRYGPTATLLLNGKVLLLAGNGAGATFLNAAELYDPATGTWEGTSALPTPRSFHTASLLPGGKVLVASGQVDLVPPTSSAVVYDPAIGTWAATGALAEARSEHTATVLQSGMVLAVGGNNGAPYLASTELYHPTAQPTLALAASANPSVLGASVTLTATMGSASSPTGTVAFSADGVPLACAAPPAISGSTATCTVSGLLVGAHTLTASYAGDASNSSATSFPLAHTVDKASLGTGPTGVTVSGPPGCVVGSLALADATPADNLPANATAPLGVLRFTATGCAGATLTITVDYPAGSLTGLTPYKFGPASAGATPNWFAHGGKTGDSVTYTVTDNGTGDNQSATSGPNVGVIEDPHAMLLLAPAPGGAQAIPTLSEWGLALLAAVLGMLGARGWRRPLSL